MGLLNFLAKNMKYPTLAQENSIKGKVVVQFVVNEDGKLSDFKVIKSVHQYLDNEALRVVKLLPKFIPALDEQGNPVKAYVTILFDVRNKLIYIIIKLLSNGNNKSFIIKSE
ncbi:MAG: energy transducer TonB [Parabacteroides distasonis]